MAEVSVVEEVLSERGIVAERLPEQMHEQADWLVKLPGRDLLIEEKIKFDDPSNVLDREAKYAAGAIHGQSTPLTYKAFRDNQERFFAACGYRCLPHRRHASPMANRCGV